MTEVVEFDSSRTGLALLGDISTEVGMALPASTTYGQWEAVGLLLGEVQRRTPWMIGDWYVFGEAAFGTKAEGATISLREEGAAITGVNVDTISTYAWVARKIPAESRSARLRFSHHREVVDLPPKERDKWLKRTIEKGWSVRDLHAALKAKSVGAKSTDDSGLPTTAPTYTPREALTAIRSDEIWREVADSALKATLICPHCGGEVPLV